MEASDLTMKRSFVKDRVARIPHTNPRLRVTSEYRNTLTLSTSEKPIIMVIITVPP